MLDKTGQVQEQTEALLEFESRQRQRIVRGKILVLLLAIAMGVDGLLVFLRFENLLSILVSAALAVALYKGVRWVKVLLIVGFGLGVPLTLYMLLQGGLYFPSRPLGGAVYTPAVLHPLPAAAMVLHLAFCLAACLLLLFSRSVKEFLYTQQNG